MTANSDRGKPFLAVAWTLTAVATLVYALRIYSRGLLTRSLGSDDFMMVFAVILGIAGNAANTFQVQSGLGRHRASISDENFATDQMWETIAWQIVFISYFFLRASVMLFVSRLLPSYKLWQHRLIYLLFFINFAITAIATVTYAVQCIPFEAIWNESIEGKCFTKDLIVTVTQVNGYLACIIDILTAMVPELLLWNVAMKPRTKRILNAIFALGLLTACTSIGRAATINSGALKNDTTWRLMPSKWFGMLEEKLGIIFACCPALRQLWSYRQRVGTFMPTSRRQHRDEDFKKMRGRISWRDVFWYSKKKSVPDKAYRGGASFGASREKKAEVDQHPVAAKLQGVSKPDDSNRDVEAAFRGTTDSRTQNRVIDQEAHDSRLTLWQRKFRGLFMASSGSRGSSKDNAGVSIEMSPDSRNGSSSHRRLLGKGSDHRYHPSHETQDSQSRGMTETRAESERIGGRYRAWGLLPDRTAPRTATRDNNEPRPFLADETIGQSMGCSRAEPEPSGTDRPSRDHGLADMLAQPITRPAAVLGR